MTEPFDVVVALRALEFGSKDEMAAWLCRPNPDLAGESVAMMVQRGRYDDAIRAIAMEVGRWNVRKYHPELGE